MDRQALRTRQRTLVESDWPTTGDDQSDQGYGPRNLALRERRRVQPVPRHKGRKEKDRDGNQPGCTPIDDSKGMQKLASLAHIPLCQGTGNLAVGGRRKAEIQQLHHRLQGHEESDKAIGFHTQVL